MSTPPGHGRPDPAFSEKVVAALRELVRLKDMKDRFGETATYRAERDRAWEEARRLLAFIGLPADPATGGDAGA